MKNRKAKKKNQTKRWIFISSVVVVVGALIAGVAIWRHHSQTTAQNNTFQQTNSSLAGVANEVVAQVPGGEAVGSSYCSRNSIKYGQGDRSCVAQQNLLYAEEEGDVSQAAQDIQVLIEREIGKPMTSLNTKYDTNKILAYSFSLNELKCSVEYYDLYNDGEAFSYSQVVTGFSYGLRVTMGCSGDAMADYFPSVE